MEASVVAPVASGVLAFRLLGELEVRRGREVLSLPPSRRTRALLGFLVVKAAPQSRASLCDLLWEGPDDPRASLRWSLTKLRAIVDNAEARRLHADRERVGFEARACDIDTRQVEQLLAAGVDAAPTEQLAQAAQALQGEFLDGLDLPACYRFHHWCIAERERFGRLRRAVLATLVARLAHEPERALPFGRAMVEADPLAEAAHATLVGLLAASGRYPDAERHYEWARELLRREIALPGGGALDDAIHRVRRAQREASAATPAVAAEAAAPAVEAISEARRLVGRDPECEAIERMLAGRAPAGLHLFCGEPGIGKTRLLDELAARALATGRGVIRGRCFEAEAVRPYGAWLDALRSARIDGWSADSRESLFDAAAALLRELAARRPIVVIIDDLQWIDDASAALMHYLLRQAGDGARILIAGGARVGELDDNAAAKSLVQSLAREGSLHRLLLRPVDAEAARALLGRAPIDAADALRQSGGNPLYLIELAQAAGRGAGAIDRSLQGLIDERVRALDERARELLAWGAAMGGELRPELLAAAAGLPVAEVLARLALCERRGLLAATGAGHFDFAHDLVRRGLYHTLSHPYRRALHLQIARALAAAGADDPSLQGAIAYHASLAGDALRAVRACVAAAEHCLRVFANAEAAQVAERGLAQLPELAPATERVRIEIALLRLRVAAAAGPSGARLPALGERIARAIEAAEALGLPADAASAWEILAFWRQQAGDSAGAEEATLAAARMTRRADAATQCLQLANSGRCLLDIEADPGRGRALLDEAARMARELDLRVMEIDWGRGLAARDDGDLVAAGDALARAVALARAADNHWRAYECMAWLATVRFEQGRLADVGQLVGEIVAAAAKMGEPQVPFAQALDALVRLRRGDAEAEAALALSLVALRDRDDKGHLAYVLNEVAALRLAAGQRNEATENAQEALAAARAVRRTTEIAVAAARLATAAIDSDRAAAWLAEAPGDAALSARARTALAGARQAIAAASVPTVTATTKS